jgi:hypothetical protein
VRVYPISTELVPHPSFAGAGKQSAGITRS